MRQLFYLLITACSILSTGIASAKESAEAHTLKVVSYNIRHGEGMDDKIDLKRIADHISQTSPDLVVLQEVDKNCTRSGNQDLAKELGGLLKMDHRFGKFMDLQGGEYGMAVLSRLPIKETIAHPLPKGAEPRCALEVKVELDGLSVPVSLLCIHNDWTNEKIRTKQVTALMKALKNYSNPIILAGDFNGQRSDDSIKLLEEDGWKILDKGGKKTFPSYKPRVEIDFIMVKNLKLVEVVHDVLDEPVISDHKAIYATMTFQPE